MHVPNRLQLTVDAVAKVVRPFLAEVVRLSLQHGLTCNALFDNAGESIAPAGDRFALFRKLFLSVAPPMFRGELLPKRHACLTAGLQQCSTKNSSGPRDSNAAGKAVLDNVRQRYRALSAALFITQTGTHWADWLMAKRATVSAPSAVLRETQHCTKKHDGFFHCTTSSVAWTQQGNATALLCRGDTSSPSPLGETEPAWSRSCANCLFYRAACVKTQSRWSFPPGDPSDDRAWRFSSIRRAVSGCTPEMQGGLPWTRNLSYVVGC